MQAIGTIISTGTITPGRNWYADRDRGDIRNLEPVRLADLDTRHHPLVRTAVDAARAWAVRYKDSDTRAPSLILSGPNGTGKTHIARAIWWSMTQAALDADGSMIPGSRRPIGKFFHAAELIASLAPDDELGGQLMPVGQVIGSSPLVVIDDVGAENTIAYVKGEYQQHERQVRYFRFIDWAYSNDVPVVITTNVRLDEMSDHVGQRAWDRLNEMAPAGQMVSLWGVPSWRVKVGGR